MLEQSLWHPVALSDGFAQRPLAVRLLGQDVVLWRDAEGVAHAFADQCPHRGARLSLGRIEAGRLECPYHGWQFAPQGACVRVPALPGFTPPAGHAARVFEVQEAHGLAWVRLAGGDARLPVFAAEGDPQLRKLNCGPYDVACSAPRIVENFLDLSHFSFVHEDGLGSRTATAIDDYLVEHTPTGLRAVQCKAWQPQSSVHSTMPAQVEYGYEVVAPYTAVLTKVPDAATLAARVGQGGYRESIALFVCPVEPERSRVWFRLALADFESHDDVLRAFQDAIFLQDQPVLESQRPRSLPLDPQAERHVASDKASVAYRRYLRQTGITFGVC